MFNSKVKKISNSKYQFKLYDGDACVGRLMAIASNRIKFSAGISYKLDGNYWVIDEIEVMESRGGQGIGTELLQLAIADLASTRNMPLALVPPLNQYTDRIIRWYRRNGFEPVGSGVFIRPKVKTTKWTSGK